MLRPVSELLEELDFQLEHLARSEAQHSYLCLARVNLCQTIGWIRKYEAKQQVIILAGQEDHQDELKASECWN